MAMSSAPNTKNYGGDPYCLTCGRKVAADESAWFRGFPLPAGVFCDHVCYRNRKEG